MVTPCMCFAHTCVCVQDFADTIPGHGGILDRMDCQFTMGSFTAIYIRTFVSGYVIAFLTSLLSSLFLLCSHTHIGCIGFLQKKKKKNHFVVFFVAFLFTNLQTTRC